MARRRGVRTAARRAIRSATPWRRSSSTPGRKDPDARLNLLACDGESIAATVWGDTLFLHLDDGVLVASEPLDDRPGWQAVPDRTLVLASPEGVRFQPL